MTHSNIHLKTFIGMRKALHIQEQQKALILTNPAYYNQGKSSCKRGTVNANADRRHFFNPDNADRRHFFNPQ